MRISEVCEKLNLTQDTLRYYEKIRLIPEIKETASGFREYTELDCERIAMIKWMRAAGMPIETLAKYIAMARNGDETISRRKELLLKLRDRLNARGDEVQAILRLLEYKIECYETRVAQEEEKLFLSGNAS